MTSKDSIITLGVEENFKHMEILDTMKQAGMKEK